LGGHHVTILSPLFFPEESQGYFENKLNLVLLWELAGLPAFAAQQGFVLQSEVMRVELLERQSAFLQYIFRGWNALGCPTPFVSRALASLKRRIKFTGTC